MIKSWIKKSFASVVRNMKQDMVVRLRILSWGIIIGLPYAAMIAFLAWHRDLESISVLLGLLVFGLVMAYRLGAWIGTKLVAMMLAKNRVHIVTFMVITFLIVEVFIKLMGIYSGLEMPTLAGVAFSGVTTAIVGITLILATSPRWDD